MAVSIQAGPEITTGNQSPIQNQNPDAGPNLVFQGEGVTDPRFVQSIGSAPTTYERNLGLYQNPQITLVDGFPQAPVAAGITTITAGAVVPAGGSLLQTLTGTNASLGFNTNVPVVGWTTTRNSSGFGLTSQPNAYAAANVTLCTALDFGPTIFTLPATGTTTGTALSNNSTTPGAVIPGIQSAISFPANQILTVLAQSTTNWKNPLKFYQPYQYVIVPGAGNAAGTTCLVAQILAIDYINGYLVLNTPVLNTSSNSTGVGVGSADPLGFAAFPYTRAGAIGLFDPAHMIARSLLVTSASASDTGYTLQVNGFDIWGQPLTEQIAVTANSTTLGKKAWKYIANVTLLKTGGGTTVGNITLGTPATTSGLFGFPLYIDQFEYLALFVNGAYVTSNTGFTAGLAFTTNPATFTTVDNRGTYAMQTAPTGAVHLALYANLPQYQTVLSNNLGWQQLFGLVQT